MKRKIVRVTSHGPLSFSKIVEIGWEDVWLRVHSGRQLLKLAPCLVSREHLRSDIALAEKIAHDPRPACAASAETREFHEKEAAELRALMEKVDASGYAMDHSPKRARRSRDPGRDFALANVYTRRAWMDRAEAERMLDHYLKALGMRGCVYKWKGSRFIAWPTTIDADVIAA